jgi:hypothetical protein
LRTPPATSEIATLTLHSAGTEAATLDRLIAPMRPSPSTRIQCSTGSAQMTATVSPGLMP